MRSLRCKHNRNHKKNSMQFIPGDAIISVISINGYMPRNAGTYKCTFCDYEEKEKSQVIPLGTIK